MALFWPPISLCWWGFWEQFSWSFLKTDSQEEIDGLFLDGLMTLAHRVLQTVPASLGSQDRLAGENGVVTGTMYPGMCLWICWWVFLFAILGLPIAGLSVIHMNHLLFCQSYWLLVKALSSIYCGSALCFLFSKAGHDTRSPAAWALWVQRVLSFAEETQEKLLNNFRIARLPSCRGFSQADYSRIPLFSLVQ
jgi:hypothetical protein